MNWNYWNRRMYKECKLLTDKFCLLVKYERLVLHTEATVRRVMRFLNETFVQEQLQHERHIGEEVVLAKNEWSAEQVRKPVNTNGLGHPWVDKVPDIDLDVIKKSASFLKTFGYNLTIGIENEIKNKTKPTNSTKPDIIYIF